MPEQVRPLKAPWKIIEHRESFEIQDATGTLHLAYIYFEDEPQRRSNLNRLTREEARRVAVNIAKLPDLLQR